MALLSVSSLSSAFAAELIGKQAIVDNLPTILMNRNNKLVDYIKNNSNKNVINAVDTFIEAHKIDVSKYKVKDFQNKALVKKVNINDNTTIEFNSDGSFVVDTLTSKPILNQVSSTSLMTTRYKWAANDRIGYNAWGMKLYRIHVESNFGYDGVSAWYAGGLMGYYERYFGPGGFWQVSNWDTGTTVVNGGEYCRAYARGNFHFGIEYQGIGWVIQDIYEDVRVSVNYDGTVYRN
ncbi:hypothetical protein ACETAC_01890 [Aceticella autotrophica]|uniref:Uncharacterized protein n=1 Tax=Aceticella autotrophica TaxID=2755338 RepID=A0A975AWC0_9THEO|nr:hypothetical protein [Aceticella autotrophica]QSZ27680.1 hypothetical protein ACETAC_01890 [Aceticella autotrophica]